MSIRTSVQFTFPGLILTAMISCSVSQVNSNETATSTPKATGAQQSESQVVEDFEQPVRGTAKTIQMIAIPAGTIPGSSRTIGPFWMSKTEVTWDIFDVFVYERDKEGIGPEPEVDAITRPSKPYVPPDRGFGHEGYPAISIRYQSAKSFCEWLSARTGKKYRLPSEEEWSYACRAGGEALSTETLDEHAWFEANAQMTTHPVGRKKPNAFGLYDMLGNVAEWCATADDPNKGVLCGGHYDLPAAEISFQSRLSYDESWQMTDPQVPKSPWWLSDGPFAGFRIICISSKEETTDEHR